MRVVLAIGVLFLVGVACSTPVASQTAPMTFQAATHTASTTLELSERIDEITRELEELTGTVITLLFRAEFVERDITTLESRYESIERQVRCLARGVEPNIILC